MALTAAVDRPHYVDQKLREFQVATNVKIYKGALLSVRSTGYVGPLVAGAQSAGIAFETADNTGGANGAKKVRAYVQGDFELPLSGAAITDIGDAIYGTADDATSKTAASNTYIGVIVGFVSSTTVIVRINDAFGRTAAP
ncbi:MAG: hypothetical protein HY763_16895 [Planctomycetes bacterium]|nr:hypothetical protein [Planctomycetota bacterium]